MIALQENIINTEEFELKFLHFQGPKIYFSSQLIYLLKL